MEKDHTPMGKEHLKSKILFFFYCQIQIRVWIDCGKTDVIIDQKDVLSYNLYVKTTQNSTCGTGTHSAGKLTKTEVNGKEDR